MYKKLIPKTIGNRKRDCAWGCARRINTTSENLQIEKHKSVWWAERTPSWFVFFDLQIFWGGVYPPSATSRTISFLFPIVFGINLIHFSMRRRTVQPEIRSLVLLLRTPVTPFDSANFTKNSNCSEEWNVFGNGKSELSANQKRRNEGANFWQGKVQNSSPILARQWWRHFRLSLFLCISLSLSPSVPHAQYVLPSISLSLYLSLSLCLSLTERTSRTICRKERKKKRKSVSAFIAKGKLSIYFLNVF